jgi:hypothetical protein
MNKKSLKRPSIQLTPSHLLSVRRYTEWYSNAEQKVAKATKPVKSHNFHHNLEDQSEHSLQKKSGIEIRQV